MTYSELCNLLEIKEDSSHKSRHIKRLQCKYNIIINGKNDYSYFGKYNEYEIIENKIGHKKDRLYLEPLIYTKLLNQKDKVIYKKMGEILEMFGLINSSYYPVKWNIEIAEDIAIVNNINYKEFIDITEPILKRIVYEVLMDMEDRFLIKVEFIPHGVKREYKYIDGNLSKDKYSIEYDLENDMDYEEAFRLSAKELGYAQKSKIKWFDQIPIRKLTASKLNYDWIFFKYRITINEKGIQDYVLNDFYGVRHSFNYYIQDKIKRNKEKYKLIADDSTDILIDMLISDRNLYKFNEKIPEIKRRKKEEEEKKNG